MAKNVCPLLSFNRIHFYIIQIYQSKDVLLGTSVLAFSRINKPWLHTKQRYAVKETYL